MGNVWTCMELMTVFSYIKYINDLQLLSRTKEFDGIDRDLPWTTMAMGQLWRWPELSCPSVSSQKHPAMIVLII